jgi:hypothetical protein
MGYTTIFNGQITVDPPLNPEEIAYLEKFAKTRRMTRAEGPYYVAEIINPDNILDPNIPPDGQPNVHCQWVPTKDGEAIKWDGGEKFRAADEWMQYLIDHFIGNTPRAKATLPFLQGHVLNGEIEASGEHPDDRWKLIVEDNELFVAEGYIVYAEPRPIKPCSNN